MEDQQTKEKKDPLVAPTTDPEITDPLLVKLNTIEDLITKDLTEARDSLTLRDQSIVRLQEIIYEHEKRVFSNIEENLLRDLCLYKDKLDKVGKRFIQASNTITSELDYLSEEFDDLLYGLGISEIEQEGLVYDRTTQKVKKHQPTEDPALHHVVIAVLKPGYTTENKVLRKQEVSIYIYQKPTENE